MPKLTQAAWIAHDLGLAAAIGGTLFGRTALDPALETLTQPRDRDRVNRAAWSRYGRVTLAAHAAIAAPWLVGRFLLSGREVSAPARALTRVKDVLLAVSLASCAASAVLGAAMSRRRGGGGPATARAEAAGDEARTPIALDRATDVASAVNLAANVAIVGVTAALALEGAESVRFAAKSRRLP